MFKAFLLDNTILLSNSGDSGLTGKVYQHVLPGGLQIVQYNKFAKLLTRGPKYSGKKAKSTITEGLNDCINTWCCKHEIDKSGLMEWKSKINKVNKKNKDFVQRNIFNVS